MKQLIGALLVFGICGLVSACSSDLADQCDVTKTCPVPCNDPAFAQSHPTLCLSDGGAPEMGVAEGGDGGGDDGAGDTSQVTDARNVVDEDGSAETTGDGDAGVSTVPDVSMSADSGDAATPADAGPEVEVAPPCDGTALPSVSDCVIDDRYGIFVSPLGTDADAGTAGTRMTPVRTLARAVQLAKAQGKRIYACDNGSHYPERLMLDTSASGLELFGGFTCTWTYSPALRTTVNSAGGSALVVRNASSITFENFVFTSPDAVAPGTSSIAAIIEASNAIVLRGVNITAGRGADGQPGQPGNTGDGGPLVGATQQGMRATCAADAGGAQLGGQWPSPSTCMYSGGSRGGAGGGSTTSTPGGGGAGDPRGMNNGGAPDQPGNTGLPGAPGMPGTAAAAFGTFSPMGYTVGPSANAGLNGAVGQGGGGGGGSTVQNDPSLASCLGASGGAGGMGGCGGQGGGGGTPGGASVALLVWQSDVTLDASNLTSNTGGDGGDGGAGGGGGPGRAGAQGGAGLSTDAGASIAAAGAGGTGGSGGAGGPGAGGHGGPSYALAYAGALPSPRNNPTYTVVAGGMGGQPGGVMGARGANGDSARMFTIIIEAGAP